MAVTIEQILLRLGVDQSQVGPALEEFISRTRKSTKEAHAFYEHVGRSGRMFHKVLENINEAIPGMGTAFQLWMNPIVGGLAAGILIFTKVHEHIKEVNAELDKMEDLTRKPMSNMKTAASEAHVEIAKVTRELARFHEELNRSGREEGRKEELKAGIEGAKSDSDVQIDKLNKEKQLEMERLKDKKVGRDLVIAQAELELKYAKKIHEEKVAAAKKERDLIAGTKEDVNKEFNAAKDNLETWKRLATNQAQEKDMADVKKWKEEQDSAKERIKRLEELDKELARKREEASHYRSSVNPGLQANRDFADAQKKEAENYQKLLKEREEIERRDKQIKDTSERVQAVNEKLSEAKDRFKSANKALGDFDTSMQAANRKLGQLQLTPPQGVTPIPGWASYADSFKGTIHELATSGYWSQRRIMGGRAIGRPVWMPGPDAMKAQAVERLEAEAHAATLAKNFDLANKDMAAARLLRDQLGAGGSLKSSEFLDSMSKDIGTILQLAKTSGLNVNPANGK